MDAIKLSTRSPAGRGPKSWALFLLLHAGLVFLFLRMPPFSLLAANASSCFDNRCQDDPSYRTALGLSCDDHHGIFLQSDENCFSHWFETGGTIRVSESISHALTEEEVFRLVQACPCACNVDCGESHTLTIANTPAPSVAAAASSCFDNRCQDDPSYRTALGLSCDGHHGLFLQSDENCFFHWFETGGTIRVSESISHALTEEEVFRLVQACPCACNVDCGESHTLTIANTPAPSVAGASSGPSPPSYGKKRVAILYSEVSRDAFWGEFAYYQVIMGMQYQCAMAGIPYDLVDVSKLAGSANPLLGATPTEPLPYSALIIPMLYPEFAMSTDRPKVITALTAAADKGLHILTSGSFDWDLHPLIGVQYVESHSQVQATVHAGAEDHPALPNFEADELIVEYKAHWANIYEPISNHFIESSVLCNYHIGDAIEDNEAKSRQGGDNDKNNTNERNDNMPAAVIRPAVHALSFPNGRRVVHFANTELMHNMNVLWSALQWVIFGNEEMPVGIQLGREESIFFARNDMDLSQYRDEVPLVHFPILDIITDWKEKYNFVSSYYINIGNIPEEGRFTDWGISGPLYHKYQELGSEIGTHSYTHPHETSLLTSDELEFEFLQSKQEIEIEMGFNMYGAAVPGMPESMTVVETVAPWLNYMSGRSATAGTLLGYSAGAFGKMRPDLDLFYFTLNTSPDFTLISWKGHNADVASQIWLDELAEVQKHAPLPVVHWLWHDYAAVGHGNYTLEMLETMVESAANTGTEFVTGEDLFRRVEALQASTLDVIQLDDSTVKVQVTGNELGHHCLSLREGKVIRSVPGWYAWDGKRVFLPQGGGTYTINTGGAPVKVTRIIKLPHRARLLALQGDGTSLSFTIYGEGNLVVNINESNGPLMVNGAGSVIQDGSNVVLNLPFIGQHTVSIEPVGVSPTLKPTQSRR